MLIPKIEVPKIVYVDIDNTINYYHDHFLARLREYPNLTYPQSMPGFYLNILPMEDGLESIKALKEAGYDVYLASRPSYPNTHCYTEKAEWVKKHLGEDWLPKLILTPNKSLLIGDYLVDDCNWDFKGRMILFDRNWPDVVKQIVDN